MDTLSTCASSTVAKRRSPTTPAAYPTHSRQSRKEMELRQDGSESDEFINLVEWKKRHMADRGHNTSTITKKRQRLPSSDSSQYADQPGSSKGRGKRQKKSKKQQKHPSEATGVKVKDVGESQLSQSSGIGKLQPLTSPGQWPKGYGSNSSQSTGVSSPAYDSNSDPEWRSPKKNGKRKFQRHPSGLSSSSSGQAKSPVKKKQKKQGGSGVQQAIQPPVVHPHSQKPNDDSSSGPHQFTGGVKPSKGRKETIFYRYQVVHDWNVARKFNEVEAARRLGTSVTGLRISKKKDESASAEAVRQGKPPPSLELFRQLFEAVCNERPVEELNEIVGSTDHTRKDTHWLVKDMRRYVAQRVVGKERLPPLKFSAPNAHRLRAETLQKRDHLIEIEVKFLDQLSQMKPEDRKSADLLGYERKKEVTRGGAFKVADVTNVGRLPSKEAHVNKLNEMLLKKLSEDPTAQLTELREGPLGGGLNKKEPRTYLFLLRVNLEEQRLDKLLPSKTEAIWREIDGGQTANVGATKKVYGAVGNVRIPSISSDDETEPELDANGNKMVPMSDVRKALMHKFVASSWNPLELKQRRKDFAKLGEKRKAEAAKLLLAYCEYCQHPSRQLDPWEFEGNFYAWMTEYLPNTTTKSGKNKDLCAERRLMVSTVQGYHRCLSYLAIALGLLPHSYQIREVSDELSETYRKQIDGVSRRQWTSRATIPLDEVDNVCLRFLRSLGKRGFSEVDLQNLLIWVWMAATGKRPQSFAPHEKGRGSFNGVRCRDIQFVVIGDELVMKWTVRHEKQSDDPEVVPRKWRDNQFDLARLMILHLIVAGAVDVDSMDIEKGFVPIRESHADMPVLRKSVDLEMLSANEPLSINGIATSIRMFARTAHLPLTMMTAKSFRRTFAQTLVRGLMAPPYNMTPQEAKSFLADAQHVRTKSTEPYLSGKDRRFADYTFLLYGPTQVKQRSTADCDLGDVTLMLSDSTVEYWEQADTAVKYYVNRRATVEGWDQDDKCAYRKRLLAAGAANNLNERSLMNRRSGTTDAPVELKLPLLEESGRKATIGPHIRVMAKEMADRKAFVLSTTQCAVKDCRFTPGHMKKAEWMDHLKKHHNFTGAKCPVGECVWIAAKGKTPYWEHYKGVHTLHVTTVCETCGRRIANSAKKGHGCPMSRFDPWRWTQWCIEDVSEGREQVNLKIPVEEKGDGELVKAAEYHDDASDSEDEGEGEGVDAGDD